MLLATPQVLPRSQREGQGFTQQRLADVAGVSPRFLIELERGRPTVGLGLTLRVLATLGVDLEWSKRGAR